MASGGYGRGGRGAALLQALSKPARKPGETDEQQESTPKLSAAGAAPTPGSTAAAPMMGRGAFLQGLLQGARTVPGNTQQIQVTPGTTGSKPPQPVVGGGRGVADLQALLKTAGRGMPQFKPPPVQQESKVTTPPQADVPPPVSVPQRPASPTSSTTSSTAPPTSRFSRMALDRKEAIHKPGNDGEHVKVSGNYIRIKCHNAGVYQYHVSFKPNIDSKNMRFQMVNEHRDVIGNTKAFDGAILYLPIKLNQETVLHSTRITDGTDVVITIRLTKVVPPQQCVPLYNIIFRRIMHVLEMVQVGRYYYNPKTPSAVPQHKLEVWPGYITAVQENEGGLMLLADASHRVLRTETVLQVLHSIVQKNPNGFTNECTNVLVGNIVLTRYNNKTYRIDDIIWSKSPLDTFESSSGKTMTFIEYYKKAYNKDIADHEQPLLLHRPKKKNIAGEKERNKLEAICLIPELCYMTGLTDELRKDFAVTKDLGCHTRVNPAQRVAVMKKFVNAVNNNADAKKELTNWGLSLEDQTLDTDGRIVPGEKIIFGGNQSVHAGQNAEWGRDATRCKVITAVDLINWIVIYTRKDTQRANDYISMTLKCCPQMGISCNPPTRFEIRDDRTETYIKSLRENINQSVQAVVVIFPTSRDDKYSAVKKFCCVECPVPSQVIISRTISKPQKLRSVTQKIALQINCKLGGELWGLDIPLRNLMVVGIDVYHDAARGKRSIAGFVSSTNKMCTRWYSRTCFQLPGQELVDGLKVCMTSAIRKYHEVNHVFPAKIVVFRDGVGDGDLPYTKHEVMQLEQCFSQFGEEYKPMMNVVIVQKRINTRIFMHGNRGFENPPPGTVVDHTITRREWYDFFLVSQHVTQGTVSPTHYISVHDTTNLKPDHLQRLAYKMTHLYYNWPGTVRVPAPCQYAHKLAYLVGQSIHKEPSTELSDRLFFL